MNAPCDPATTGLHAGAAGIGDGKRASPLRVAVVSSVHRWNDTRIFVKQAASLAARGYAVTLVAIGDQPETFERLGMRVQQLPRRGRGQRWRTWLEIARIVRQGRAQVVHAHDPELFPLMALMRLAGRRVVCDVHEDIAEQVLHKEWIPAVMRAPLSHALRMGLRALPRLADAVVLAEDSYARNFPGLPNVSIVRNFPLLPPRWKTDWHSAALRLVYVGDVRRVRGIEQYLRITARLLELGVPARLRVVGSFADAGEEGAMRALVSALGIAGAVELMGRRPPEDIPALVRDCDVGLALLHPIGNYRESYPTKMFEYMAAGLPALVSDFALWREVLLPNDCGRVVDPLDVEAAVRILQDYWRSPALRERHGRNGRAAVETRYQWACEERTLAAVYRQFEQSLVA